MVINRSNWGQC